ncbi:MAG: UDP-N-acetylmuramate dehydrogenase [Clostridiales bacterium]|nr:UDP-N-acetylmuramate dehydrogenase [Clostridiales bacterium]
MENFTIAFEELKNVFKDRVTAFEPMNLHTSFRVGGPADIFIKPVSLDEALISLSVLREYNIPSVVIGKGSNILVGDKGVRGGVIQLSALYSEIKTEGSIVTAAAGAALSSVASVCLENSLTGFEFASGIPGSVGGAVCMNAGAYGGELKNIVSSVKILRDGEIHTIPGSDCGFRYRGSRIMDEGMLVLDASFELKEGSYEEISEKMRKLSRKRNEKQPMEYPSAGSTFKHPEGYFAGKLIEECGLKGFSLGGAQVSEKHCGFIINKNNATAKDIADLIEYVRETVNKKFNVELEPEVKFVGEFV